MSRIQMETVDNVQVKRVQERHASGHIDRESERLCIVDYESALFVQHMIQTAMLYELTDHDQVRRIVCAAQHWQYVRMREYSQFRKFVGERARRPSDHVLTRIIAQIQELGHNLAVLPNTDPSIAGIRGCDLLLQMQILDWNARVSAQRRIFRSGLGARPAQIFERYSVLDVLLVLLGQSRQTLGHLNFAFVQRRFVEFIAQVDESTVHDQRL